MSRPESPYLAFIVGLHVATAAALIIYFRHDWARIVTGLVSSLRDRTIATAEQKLAWMIVLATIPVGLSGLALEHTFRVVFSKPVLTALFLTVNGVILLAGERARRRSGEHGAAQQPAVGHAGHLAARDDRGRLPGSVAREVPRLTAVRPAATARPAVGGQPRDGQGPAAGRDGLRQGHRDRRRPGLRPAAGHQPGRHGHRHRHVPRPVPGGRGPLLLPAVPPRLSLPRAC